ncbi:hypothetical protein B0I72DRAFT_13914 [Yarrowia lipolytica]|uniref:YALI0A11891p n=2 Tax=Yarrowia lipolytica TaxID=4952 RepID=Q6CH66_YARLI|nr:YALI0A11891p [Yarrowia lipolytica CLIB122]AOW00551.1 hypothetical protein YALI1_A12152g [Yarrowia lipolytica]KAB8279894.1 hypothetical protein BKA91DRAFT_3575 [Yarrowia lipolytica]KAE8169040.1 hypothetical protein BKA90DRAFT_5046 [Yarrowia lipolytica]KAJ8051600.1 hypothetical protein LXG23DRAFT_51159 [Yarrowia lipolytica]RDW22868.1 hypothetical protein B0I71DRAFT_20342 [Yarrowia lipolytica]|eukprot:XP_499996.1 YALI0A11891p [Yarrowia lipolytica CLIB122]
MAKDTEEGLSCIRAKISVDAETRLRDRCNLTLTTELATSGRLVTRSMSGCSRLPMWAFARTQYQTLVTLNSLVSVKGIHDGLCRN